MRRRNYLASLGSLSAVSLAGCSQTLGSGGGSNTLDFGDSDTHNGVQITVSDFMTTREMGEKVTVTSETVTRTPSSRIKIFLLTRIAVSHVGETESEIPNLSPMSHGEFSLVYNGDEVDIIGGVNRPPYYVVDGERYQGYEHQVDQGTNGEPVFDKSFSGWIAHPVPEDFAPETAELSISWGGETATWDYISE